MLTQSRLTSSATTPRACPACDCVQPHREVYRKWGYPILKCSGCGLGCTDAAGFDPHAFYTTDYFTGGHRDGYGDYTASAPVLQAEFRSVLKDLQRAGGTMGKLLEIGCAYGYFLDVANTAGYETTGIEICEAAVESCQQRGLNVTAGVVKPEYLKQHGPFDCVVMLDVIEHLPNPDEMFTMLSEAVKPGGYLVITTGNWGSLLSRTAGSRWRLMTPPQHLYFYSRSTLSKLVSNHGFKVKRLSAPWKRVPLGLMAYQITRRLGLKLPLPNWLHHAGLPVNLFDAMRLVARKEPS
ncbi:hypothetical protein BH11PLA2_BH11PLA2_37250 [soil metagenome]